MPLRYTYGKLTFEEVRRFLMETDGEFLTPLSTHINIDAYAKKLSEFSDFSVCRDENSIVGMISCYTNRPPMGYISNVCVKKQYQGQKVFSRLYHNLLHHVESRGVSVIRLEVDSRNEKAQSVYRHFGFNTLEINAETGKILMEVMPAKVLMKKDTYEIVSPKSFLDEEVRCGFKVTSKRKKLWQMQMELFQFVDSVCKKNDIRYFAIGGTLLGAVRHQGYVPWDDDMDIAMFRSDYERFVRKAIMEVEDPFFVQSPETEEDYALSHIKIRNSKSTGATKFDFEFKYNKGVFIDVFPIDNIPDNPQDKADLLKGVHDYRKLLDVGARHFWYWQGFIKGNKEVVPEEEKSRLSSYVRKHSIPVICRDFDKLCTKYNDEETENCGILALELTSERFHWKRSWFSKQVLLPFEYLSIQCPYEYDAVLRKTYGDYSAFVRGGALHGSLLFEPDIPYTDYVLSEESSILD